MKKGKKTDAIRIKARQDEQDLKETTKEKALTTAIYDQRKEQEMNNRNETSLGERPLQFVEFMNNQKEFLGMVDSGAQINVISPEILLRMNFQVFSYPTRQAKGISGDGLHIQGWAKVPMRFSNSKRVAVQFAIVSGIRSTILLGLPFLRQTKSVVDFENLILSMPEGPLQLLEGKATITNGVNTITYTEDEMGKKTPDICYELRIC